MPTLLHELILHSASRDTTATAVIYHREKLSDYLKLLAPVYRIH